ncbi:MAG TPA: hypothetical protein VF230_09085, partial [Acidimicrobiales bacterium]
MPDTDPATIRRVSRRLWNLIEPIASSVYFLPECQEGYQALGLDDYGSGYFTSRGACMGRAPGTVVAAAFAVFNPAIVLPAVEKGWSLTTPEQIIEARLDGARRGLRRLIGEVGEPGEADLSRAASIMWRAAEATAASPAGFPGRPMFAGLYSLGLPGDPLGDMWRAADVLREHRGDSHTLAWAAMRLSSVEVTLLTEAWWGGKLGRYIRTRGWDDASIAEGIASLQSRGFITTDDPPGFTDAGEEVRAVVEEMTDQGEAPVV